MPTTTIRSPRLRRAACAALALVTIGAGTVACRTPQRYDVANHVTGLNRPWDLAFAPGGELLITERVGFVGVFRNGTYTRMSGPGDVVAQGEGGMMGLALDPGFGSNRRVYTCYMTANDVRVVRWTVNAAWTGLGNRQDLVTGIDRTSGRHSGCRLVVGPNDGHLYITTGDAAESENPQSPTSLAGKVLRVNRENGQAVPGNMSAPFDSRIFAYGFRNPQGLAFRPSDGRPFLVEHGPDRDDEITPLAAGGNGGWAPGPGYNEGVPMTDGGRFPGALRPVWASGVPTIAPSGSNFVTDADWGDYRNHLAVAVLKGQELRLFNVANGANTGQGVTVLAGYGRLRAAVQGPDGRLYIATDADNGRILAVQPVL